MAIGIVSSSGNGLLNTEAGLIASLSTVSFSGGDV
jgi:hypothetical protein